MQARIYQPAKNAMQSGKAQTHHWVLDFAPAAARFADPLMGWTGSTDTQRQVRLKFETKEEAIAYAEKQGIPYVIEEPAQRSLQMRAYADNFKFDRVGRWTH
ncbi:MAG TPA: ETC complex I subunit [Terriglobales bacterium]|nr:ETC complex I subunit [Terriglobales bacterium]